MATAKVDVATTSFYPLKSFVRRKEIMTKVNVAWKKLAR